MSDREKVINGLERYLNYPKPLCNVAQQAITLLKEQEPVTYKVVKAGEKSYPFYDLVCTGCGNKTGMRMDWKYCPGCGRVVNWKVGKDE